MGALYRLFGFFERSLALLVALAIIGSVVGYGVQTYWEVKPTSTAPRPGNLVSYSGGKDTIRHWLCVGSGRSNPPVILEAPLGHGVAWWSDIQNILAKDRVVCSHDRPGIGWSQQNLSGHNSLTRKLASEIRQGMDAFGIRSPAILIGVGYGANLAMNMAAQLPKRVRYLILVDPFAVESLYGGTTSKPPLADPLRRQMSRIRWGSEIGLGRLMSLLDPAWPGEILLPRRPSATLLNQVKFRRSLRAAQKETVQLLALVRTQQTQGVKKPGVLLTTIGVHPALTEAAQGRDVNRAADMQGAGKRALRRRNPSLRRAELSIKFRDIPFISAKQAARILRAQINRVK